MAKETYALNRLARRLPPGPCDTIEEALESMHEVIAGIDDAFLKHMRAFPRAYLGVTARLKTARDRELIKEPAILEHSMTRFKWMFDKQLWAMCEGSRGDIDSYWRPPLLYLAKHPAPDSVNTASGMCAHVRGDLPKLVGQGGMNENYHQHDYRIMVGHSIEETAFEDTSEQVPNLAGLGNVAIGITVGQIGRWRETSYRQGKALEQAQVDGMPTGPMESRIERGAFLSNVALCHAGSALNRFMPADLVCA